MKIKIEKRVFGMAGNPQTIYTILEHRYRLFSASAWNPRKETMIYFAGNRGAEYPCLTDPYPLVFINHNDALAQAQLHFQEILNPFEMVYKGFPIRKKLLSNTMEHIFYCEHKNGYGNRCIIADRDIEKVMLEKDKWTAIPTAKTTIMEAKL